MTRTCEGCGAVLTRSPGSSTRDWLVKRFCTAGCRVASGTSGITPEENDADAIVMASAALRSRIIAMFEKTARRERISLEDAARLHLCPKVAA